MRQWYTSLTPAERLAALKRDRVRLSQKTQTPSVGRQEREVELQIAALEAEGVK